MRNLSTDIKVAQLGGYVSEHTGYHHGEQSLYQTIVGLAQDFVGSNNLNFLMPKGSFGSRALGGKDASAPRYIFTELNSLTRKIFNSADDPLYRYMDDDESTVEPEWYLPILPTVLVNGSEGIGTGWSTSIPPFNPVDIVNNLKRMMDGQEPETMEPWFRGWGGSVERIAADKFQISGRIEQIDDKTVEITELPARMWTQTMKEYLLNAIVKDKQDTSGWIDDFTEEHTTGIKFVVTMTHKQMENALAEGLYRRFKLTTTLSLANMVAFDPQGRIKKYETVEQILSDFYYIRLEYYQKRKDYMCERLRNQLEKLSQQARFIKMIVEKKFSVSNKKKADLMDELAELKFPSLVRTVYQFIKRPRRMKRLLNLTFLLNRRMIRKLRP
jgi:DNA topoisomerase-2